MTNPQTTLLFYFLHRFFIVITIYDKILRVKNDYLLILLTLYKRSNNVYQSAYCHYAVNGFFEHLRFDFISRFLTQKRPYQHSDKSNRYAVQRSLREKARRYF